MFIARATIALLEKEIPENISLNIFGLFFSGHTAVPPAAKQQY